MLTRTTVLLFLVLCGLGIQPLLAGTVYVQPYLVCDQNLDNCGGTTLLTSGFDIFEQATDLIWAQAGIDIDFYAPLKVKYQGQTGPVDISNSSMLDGLFLAPPHTLYPDTIAMWFSPYLGVCGKYNCYGITWMSENEIAISDIMFSYNYGAGRLDTIAHELGHSLGLYHCVDTDPISPTLVYGDCTYNASTGYSSSLMATGGTRTIPGSLTEIGPAGTTGGLDLLSADEISIAQASRFDIATPEPASAGMAVAGIGLLLAYRKRRRQADAGRR